MTSPSSLFYRMFMPKIKVNDIAMYYEMHGQGDPIIFIAGFSSDHLIWNPTIEFFKKEYQVFVLDNRGAGQTDVPKGPYSLEQMTDDVAAFCQHQSIKQAVFVGNSMGGFITQMLGRKYPELVRALIISNSAMSIACTFNIYLKAQLELLKANAPLASLIKASCAWVFSYRFLSLPGVMEQLVQMTLENPYPFTITGYEAQYAALEKFNSTTWAQDILVPSFVMAGDEDLIFIKTSVKALADAIPNAEFYSFKECGHIPALEFPKEFYQIVKKYINRL